MRVFVIQHVNANNEDDVKLIGVFSTRDSAESAVAVLRQKPGFRDTPEGFHIGEYELDRVWWEDGFVTVPNDE